MVILQPEMENEGESVGSYSLQADLATGWKPKLKVIGPMPLIYDNQKVDDSIKALLHQESAFYSIIYLGPRPQSTFKLHELIDKNYRYKYKHLLHNNFAHLKPFFSKFYSEFEPVTTRPFHGMAPNVQKKDLRFDSCFEGGNLDCAVRIRSNEYDLLMRVDANTSGHILWYYFRVSNPDFNERRVRLNLVNLRRSKSAYARGLRPYVRRAGHEWQQEGEQLEVAYDMLKYSKQNLSISLEENIENAATFRRVSFDLEMGPKETIQLAYCIPYLYSHLLNDIKHFKKLASRLPGVQMEVNWSYESLSGLEIPLIRIRNGPSGNGKYCVFMIGRQHPGESNGSHVIKGSIEALLRNDPFNLSILEHCQFVIIPMLNPDGVVAGNFRTSLYGKDLNRLFKTKDTTLLPEVQMARNVFADAYEIYKRKLLLFLDYHGHSTRKNAFVLGPGVFDAQMLNDIRTLPKIMAQHTEIFRYPSCSFRLENIKKTTARALFGKLAGLSYTIEASNWSYYSRSRSQVINFDTNGWQQLGIHLIMATQQFIGQKIHAKKQFSLKSTQNTRSKSKVKAKPAHKANTTRNIRDSASKINKTRIRTQTKLDSSQEIDFIEEQKDTVELPQEVKQANQSDEFSDNGMDSDSSGEDMNKEKFKKYIKAASQMLIEFEKVYYGDSFKRGNSKYRQTQQTRSTKLLLMKEKPKREEIIQACLRPRKEKNVQSYSQPKATNSQPRQQKMIFKVNKPKIYLDEDEPEELLERGQQRQKSPPKEQNEVQRQSIRWIEPERKGKVCVAGLMKQDHGHTEQITSRKTNRIKQIAWESPISKERRRMGNNSQAQAKKVTPTPSFLVSLKNPHFQLPSLKPTKLSLFEDQLLTKEGSSPSRHNPMLSTQKNSNLNSVMNILKLSRADDKS